MPGPGCSTSSAIEAIRGNAAPRARPQGRIAEGRGCGVCHRSLRAPGHVAPAFGEGMDRDRLLKAREIFASAAAMASAEREAHLAAACAADVEIRAHVSTLLRAHDRAGDFLADATVGTGRPNLSDSPPS